MAVRTIRAPVSAFLICASLYLGKAKTATPPATMAMIATTIKTSTSVTPRRERFSRRRLCMTKNDRRPKLIPVDFVFMGSSSFYAVQASWFAVRTVARELIGFSFAMSWTDETERMPPSVRGSFFEISITRELIEPARTAAGVVCAESVHRATYADQRGASLTNARAVTFANTQDGDRAQHTDHQQDRADSPEHEQAAQPGAAFPREANPSLADEASGRGHHWTSSFI